MVISEIAPSDVLAGCRKGLNLPEISGTHIEDELIAALLRRCAGYLCPCSRTALRAALFESLQLLDDDETLSERIDAMVDGLIIGGDLLELSDVATDDPAVRGTWLFAAPPSYIVRPVGNVFLTGIVPDQDTFLPRSLACRIAYEGFTRSIAAQPEEDLAGELHDHGLQALSPEVWLKAPKIVAADDFLRGMERTLELQPPSGPIKHLQILDPVQRVTYYRGRWVTPKTQTGNFVARRPQDYGAPIWCFVGLLSGNPDRLLDLPPTKTRWRGCDIAWCLQMAIDHCRGNPQRYRRRRTDASVRFDFFSPLPQWAQRRLMLFGQAVPRENSLISYVLPVSEAETEERFLSEGLWLQPTDDSSSESE